MSSACLCEDCSPGNVGATYTAEFKAACEARWLARQSYEDRRAYIGAVRKQRGETGAVQLLTQLMRETGRRSL